MATLADVPVLVIAGKLTAEQSEGGYAPDDVLVDGVSLAHRIAEARGVNTNNRGSVTGADGTADFGEVLITIAWPSNG